jgi:hypothetical protein
MASSELTRVVVCRYPIFYTRRVRNCPTCDRRRRFVDTDRGLWVGPILTCVGCGDSWSEGCRMERPFARGWRQRAIADARAKWAQARPYAELWAWIEEQLDGLKEAKV